MDIAEFQNGFENSKAMFREINRGFMVNNVALCFLVIYLQIDYATLLTKRK